MKKVIFLAMALFITGTMFADKKSCCKDKNEKKSSCCANKSEVKADGTMHSSCGDKHASKASSTTNSSSTTATTTSTTTTNSAASQKAATK